MSQTRYSQTSCFPMGLTGNIEVTLAEHIAQYLRRRMMGPEGQGSDLNLAAA
jgi:hypothetical protein